jgi:hypothetical protein
VAPLRLLFGSLEASVKFWATGFGFVQFREYFLCNFSETQKLQKIGNWHCGILSIGYFRKSHKNATKCNETQGKWCKNKHGASKIIDTFETYHSHRRYFWQKPSCGGDAYFKKNWTESIIKWAALGFWGAVWGRGWENATPLAVGDPAYHCMCSMQVVDITPMKHRLTSITSI